MWSHRNALRIKGWSVIAAAAAIFMLVTPIVISVYGQDWLDRGTRPLVIIATEGGGEPFSVQVRSEIDSTGALTFSYHLVTDEARDGGAAPADVRVDVIAIGRRLEGAVTCGAGSSAASSIRATALDRGPRRAYEVDRNSQGASATTAEVAAGELDVVHMSGLLSPLTPDQAVPEPSVVDGDGAVAVQQCRIDPSVLWSATGFGSPTAAARATLFAPQFNLTTIDGGAGLPTALESHLWVARADGATLVESYPQPQSDYAGWGIWFTSKVYDDARVADFYYTDQPTWLFANRDAARREQAVLVFAGIALGLAVSFLHGGINDLIDARVATKPVAE